MEGKASNGGGIGFVGLLQVCFIVGKLAGIGTVQHWSWWWVWSPTLISLCVLALFLVVIGIISLFQ